MTRARRLVAEGLGTALLLAVVIGSGTLARAASDTFAGIRPFDAPGFIAAQLLGAAAATLLFRWLYADTPAGTGVSESG